MVESGKNGFLVPVKSPVHLKEAMIRYHNLTESEKLSFSKMSRLIAETKLDMRFVIEKYLDVLEQNDIIRK